jgi:diguanylate cyclase (GGDEF)-like protein
MNASRARFAGLGTRVAARTFALFCLCAIVPIVTSAIVADRIVRTKLRHEAATRLAGISKGYGLAVFDRLQQTEEALAELATLGLAGKLTLDDIRTIDSSHYEVTAVTESLVRADPRSTTRPVALSLHGSQVRLTVFKESGARRLAVTATLRGPYLWNAEAFYLGRMQICVRGPAGQVLQCRGEEAPTDDVRDNVRMLTGEWSLFLMPRFGVDGWQVRTQQQASIALSALDSFERTLPLVTLIGIAIASLLSTVQIRRNHRPLTMLTEAVERMGRRGVHRHVKIETNDEYAHLGQAFNRMASGLARQFELLRTLARIDRMILDDPSTEALAQAILPKLPRLLSSPVVGMAVASPDRPNPIVYYATASATTVSCLHEDELQLAALVGQLDARSPELVALTASCDVQSVFGLPIEVEGSLRGVLLLADSGSRGSSMRHARAFARRFAVALGSEQRRDALLRQAYYDGLTGLPNRQLFRDRLERQLAQAKRSQMQVALLYIDLDRFKNVNDSMGHSAGDELLLAVSKRLAAQVRESDTLARLGGDEFVLIAAGLDDDPAHMLAERLQAALREPIVVHDANCFVEASIGLALYPQDGTDGEALLRNADIAMYRAKAVGRGGVMYFEETMNRDAQRRLLVEQRLRIALRERTLTLAYQPQVNLLDGSLAGVEALARWTDAQLGVVSPAEFIAVAEECGLIGELGSWALQESCSTYASLRLQGLELGHVSVNASMRQLRDERFVAEVRNALERTGMSARALEIEVTESSLADSPDEVIAVLNALRGMDVRISIDDFGTGYSSMSALGSLPTDALKIDRAFVLECASRHESRSVVEAIISIAHVLGKVTVAEGVETSGQLQTLRRLGCDFAQGYLFAKPLPAHELLTMAERATQWPEIVRNASPMVGKRVETRIAS